MKIESQPICGVGFPANDGRSFEKIISDSHGFEKIDNNQMAQTTSQRERRNTSCMSISNR